MSFPDCVPTLVNPDSGVTLRATTEDDLPGIVEQSQDAETIRWTTVPAPEGGYRLEDARSYLDGIARVGWENGTACGWTIEAARDGRRAFCGLIDLRLDGAGGGDVGFALHPGARGRSIMADALRLARDHGFDRLGLEVITWRAHVGNWPSRRVAAAAGFRFGGVQRLGLVERGRRLDGWFAAIARTDPRASLLWHRQPVLTSGRHVLRPLVARDATRIVEACNDALTRRWLPRLPQPYETADAEAFIALAHECEALGTEHTWAVAGESGVMDACVTALYHHRLTRAEIGYWAHPDARGQGVVTEAVSALVRTLRQTWPAVVIECDAANTASRAVAERCHLREAGHVGSHVVYVSD